MKTLVKVAKREKEIIERELLEMGIPHTFFTIENNEHLIQLEIEYPAASTLFLVAKAIGFAIAESNVRNWPFTL